MSNDCKHDRWLERHAQREERNKRYLTMSCEQILAMTVDEVMEFYRDRNVEASKHVSDALAPFAAHIADRFFEAHRTGDTVTMAEAIAEWKASSGIVAVEAWARLTSNAKDDPVRKAAVVEAHGHIVMKVLASFKVFDPLFTPPPKKYGWSV